MATIATLLLWSLVLTPFVYFAYHVVLYIIDVRRRGKAVDQFPGEPKHWLWGHLHLLPGLNEAGLEYFRRCTEKFPRCTQVFVSAFHPMTGLTHPETLRNILVTSEPKPMGFGVYRYGLPWIGDGLLLSQGSKWSRNRRLLTPAFHFDILKLYTLINNEAAQHLIDKLDKYAVARKNFEFFSNVSLCTFDVILRCAMSYQNDVQVTGQPWFHFDFLYYLSENGRKFKKNCEFVHSISEDIILKRKQSLSANEVKQSRYLDFLDILLTAKGSDGEGLNDKEIRDEVDTFLFEGHDTTASSISWALYSFAGHPEIQQSVQAEIDDILDGRESEDILWDDLPNLKYMTMCIKESLRLHCPVPFIERELTKPIVIDGVTLPKGSVVAIQIYNLHHNPTIWEAPMLGSPTLYEFRPERFEPEVFDQMDSFSFIPFSAGPRNCIGQHFAMNVQKVILARILRKFNISLDPDVKVEKKVSVVMETQNGMPMRVERR